MHLSHSLRQNCVPNVRVSNKPVARLAHCTFGTMKLTKTDLLHVWHSARLAHKCRSPFYTPTTLGHDAAININSSTIENPWAGCSGAGQAQDGASRSASRVLTPLASWLCTHMARRLATRQHTCYHPDSLANSIC